MPNRRVTAAAVLVLVAGSLDLATPVVLSSQTRQTCGFCAPIWDMYLCYSAPEQHYAAACAVACGELPNGASIACTMQLEGMECGQSDNPPSGFIVDCRAYET